MPFPIWYKFEHAPSLIKERILLSCLHEQIHPQIVANETAQQPHAQQQHGSFRAETLLLLTVVSARSRLCPFGADSTVAI